jgi:ethanolamine ammonia-lyase large subunit
MSWTQKLASRSYRFDDLKTLLAKATPERSGDALAGLAAENSAERMAEDLSERSAGAL